jgi:hypothetical protein
LTVLVKKEAMMAPEDGEHAELREHLIAVVSSRLLDPLSMLVDSDPAVDPLRQRVRRHAEMWAGRLLGRDEREAAHTGARLVAALYPAAEAFEPPVDWWRTPLGRVVARRVGHPGKQRLSYSDAAAMLGITRQGVHDLVRRHKLRRDPNGGVESDSVRDRLNERRAEQPGL